MKTQIAYQTPAEAGYFTTQQWDKAFQTAFELLRSDSRFRKQPATLSKSKSFNPKTNGSRQTTQEAAHVKVR